MMDKAIARIVHPTRVSKIRQESSLVNKVPGSLPPRLKEKNQIKEATTAPAPK